MLITSDKQYKPREKYAADVEIEQGTTKLKDKSWVLCSQPYLIEKKLFEQEGVWCAGTLSPKKMDEIDEATYIGLCMGLQYELAIEPAEEKLGTYRIIYYKKTSTQNLCSDCYMSVLVI